jgi:hypothetical protein
VTCLGGSPFGEAVKTGIIYIYIQYIPQLTKEYSTRGRGTGAVYSLVSVTDEYILIFLDIEKYNYLYSSALRSSIILSVNRGIYLYSSVIQLYSLDFFHGFLS